MMCLVQLRSDRWPSTCAQIILPPVNALLYRAGKIIWLPVDFAIFEFIRLNIIPKGSNCLA